MTGFALAGDMKRLFADHSRALIGAAALLLLVAGRAAGEEKNSEKTPSRWEHDVPPGVAADNPGRARFRMNREKDPLRGFEDDASGWGIETWKGEPGLPNLVGEPEPVEPERTDERASEGGFSLALPVRFPEATVLFKRSRIGEFRYVTFDVYVPAECPGRIRSLFFLKDKDGLWFQSLSGAPLLRRKGGGYPPAGGYERGPSPFRLEPGRWNTIAVDLRPGRSDLVPQAHLARWQERLARETEILGFAFLGDEPYEGRLLFDNLRGWALAEDEPPPLAVKNLTFPGRTRTYERWEARFELTREFENPFDTRRIKVDCILRTPSGERVRVPGFFSQDFQRRRTPAGEELSPAGHGAWMVRYAPREPGEYRFRLEIEADAGRREGKAEGTDGEGGVEGRQGSEGAEGRLVTRERSFEVGKSGHPGYIRISKKDPRCFEFENGEPFYPIGHNFRSPNDARCSLVLGWPLSPDEGTFTYDRILRRMAAGAENFVEVWLASWWIGLEWTAQWKHYHGLGRYNLASAWRLDHVLETARSLGLQVQLIIDNHGKYSTWCDREWSYSPYNVRNRHSGGFLARPEDFFSHEEAKRLYRQKTRYVFARWGYDPGILGFELVSELDLTGSRHGFGGRRGGGEDGPVRDIHMWHKEMTDYFREIDSGRHLYTTHYSGDYNNVDPVMVRQGGIDYVTGDGYRGTDRPFAELAYATAGNHERFGKPFMVTEYGGNWSGTSEAGLEADLHSGLWGSYMTSAAGSPLLWWFDFIDVRDLYWHFRALAEFARGEDRRDPELKGRRLSVENSPSGIPLLGMAYMSRERGYAWVYSVRAMMYYPSVPVTVEGARVRFPGVKPGHWKVEFWDTVSGERFRSEILKEQGGSLAVDLPRFANDVAMKLSSTTLLRDRREAARRPRPRAGGAASREFRSRLLAPRGKAEGPREEDFILNWAVLGPFSFDPREAGGEYHSKAARIRYVEGEADLVPRLGVKVAGREWRRYVHPGNYERSRVDLETFYKGPDYCAAYVAAEVVCDEGLRDEDIRDVTLLVGSDDYFQAYLNGKLVLTHDAGGRGCAPDQDRATGLRLRRGANLLVLKVVDISGSWACCARFTTADGRAIPVRAELPAR